MADDSLLVQLLLNSGLIQYPDVKLFKAAKLLTADERPTVPVRLFNDVRELGDLKPDPKVTAVTGPDKDAIHISRKSDAFRNPKRLAAVMAHEQAHVRGGDEYAARSQELETLQRLLGAFDDRTRERQLLEYMLAMKK